MSIHGLWSKGESNLDLFSLLVMATSNSYINLPWPSCFQHPDYLSGPCSLASVTSYVWGIFGIRTHAVRRLATAHPYVLLSHFSSQDRIRTCKLRSLSSWHYPVDWVYQFLHLTILKRYMVSLHSLYNLRILLRRDIIRSVLIRVANPVLSIQISFVVRTGIEPVAQGFSVLCSTYWATIPFL